MKLLTQDIIARLPKLGTTRGNANAEVICRFTAPFAHTSWYVTEGEQLPTVDGPKWHFYGKIINNHVRFYPDGTVEELKEQSKIMDNFSLSALEETAGIQRDTKFVKTLLKDIK